MAEIQALLSLVQGREGEEWANARTTGWRNGTDIAVCQWEGVTCDGRVIYEVNLKGTNLTGTIPYAFGLELASSIVRLDLSDNNLHGPFSAPISKLSKLVRLDLSNNQLSGFPPMFTSADLQVVDLSHNNIGGRLPDMGGSKIRELSLNDNSISGPIPNSIGHLLRGLVELDLSNNRFQGSIPDSFVKLSDLSMLSLNNNDMTGAFPHFLTGKDVWLEQIDLSHNSFSGTLPWGSIYEMPVLDGLLISGNEFTGVVPDEICEMDINDGAREGGSDGLRFRHDASVLRHEQWGGGTLEDVAEESLDRERKHNNSGGRNRSLLRRGLLEVDVGNKGSDIVVGKEGSWDDDTGCNIVACPAGFWSNDGMGPCQPCPEGSMNPYIGAVRCIVDDQAQILKSLHDATNGDGWIGDYEEWLSTSVLACNWSGVECNEDDAITSIALPNSNLVGSIPSDLGFLTELQRLDLRDNKLTGHIPSNLALAPLRLLDVGGNLLGGDVPHKLCQKVGLNGNALDDTRCDRIACPAGTSASSGRADMNNGVCEQCVDAGEAPYLGSMSCLTVAAVGSTGSSHSPIAAQNIVLYCTVSISVLLVAFPVLYYLVMNRRRKQSLVDHGGDSEFFSTVVTTARPPSSKRSIN